MLLEITSLEAVDDVDYWEADDETGGNAELWDFHQHYMGPFEEASPTDSFSDWLPPPFRLLWEYGVYNYEVGVTLWNDGKPFPLSVYVVMDDSNQQEKDGFCSITQTLVVHPDDAVDTLSALSGIIEQYEDAILGQQ